MESNKDKKKVSYSKAPRDKLKTDHKNMFINK